MNREQEEVSFQKTTIKEKIAAICLEKKRSGAERTAEKREWRGKSYRGGRWAGGPPLPPGPRPLISPQVKQEKGGGVADHTRQQKMETNHIREMAPDVKGPRSVGLFGRPGM